MPILRIDLVSKAKGGAMSIENGTSNRGAVLLAELKAVVDSFPPHQRTDVVKTLEIVFRGLDADYPSQHSLNLLPEVNTVPGLPSKEASASPDSGNENHSEDRKQKEEGER